VRAPSDRDQALRLIATRRYDWSRPPCGWVWRAPLG